MNGYGVFEWLDGRKYVGYHVDDKYEGVGTFYWTDGRKFEGTWRAGK